MARRLPALLLLLLLALPQAGLRGQTEPAVPPGSPADAAAAVPPATQDSIARPKSRADTVLVVRRSFNHREQIITGSVIMTCLALMMVVMNNYNPR